MGVVSPSARVRARKQALAVVVERAKFAREQQAVEPDPVEDDEPSAEDAGQAEGGVV